MDRQEIMKILADRFNIKPNKDGSYDINSYDWQAGSYLNGVWLNLAEVVDCIEENI